MIRNNKVRLMDRFNIINNCSTQLSDIHLAESLRSVRRHTKEELPQTSNLLLIINSKFIYYLIWMASGEFAI